MPVQRGLDSVGDEVKRRAAAHGERIARVMRKHEDGHVIGRILAPPALPVGRPWPRPSAEHAAAHDHRANVFEHLLHDRRARVDHTALLAMHLLESRELDRPAVQRLAADAERVLQTLVRPGDVAVERHGDTESQLAHLGLVEESTMRRTGPAKIDAGEFAATESCWLTG